MEVQTRRIRTTGGILLIIDEGGPPNAPTVVLRHVSGQTHHSWQGGMASLTAGG